MSRSFVSAFFSAFLAILASEIGDKTFFIAAILAMKQPRLQVFLGAFGALACMHTLSALVGSIALEFIPVQLTYYTSILLFLVTGVASLREAFRPRSEEDELEKVRSECEDGKQRKRGDRGFKSIAFHAFTLTFVAEWGDRSQLVTVGLGAVQDVVGVVLGGYLGHALCTGGAVLGGKQIAKHVEEHLISGIGGVLFLLFGVLAIMNGVPN